MIGRVNRTLTILLALAVSACSGGDGKDAGKDKGGGPPTGVIAVRVKPQSFTDRVEAVGTAYARESTTLTTTVTERIVSLNFRDGQFVPKGAVVARLAATEENADLDEAQARANEAAQQLQRLRELQQRGYATNARVDEQVALRNAAAAQANAIQARIGDRIIRAPFSGVIGLRRISDGSVVEAGTPIATLSDISAIKLDFSVPETLLGALQVGQTIEAKSAAYPDVPFRGEIDSIEPAIDPLTRSVTVRALLPNPDQQLRPGMLLTVGILSNPRTMLAVPELALVAQRDQFYVFRIAPDGTASRANVETGVRRDGLVEIRRGLQAGDLIVAEGTVRVRDGGKVKPTIRGAERAASQAQAG